MGLLSRRSKPLELSWLIPKGERLLCWASGPAKLDGQPTVVAASDLALYAPGYLDRVPWELVQSVSWDDPMLEVIFLPTIRDDSLQELPTEPEPPTESVSQREDLATRVTDGADGTTEPIRVAEQDTRLVRICLDEPGTVPRAVWERVNSTIVISRHVRLVGDRGVRLVARQLPARGVIGWYEVFDRGLDPADPRLRARADEELRILRESVGV